MIFIEKKNFYAMPFLRGQSQILVKKMLSILSFSIGSYFEFCPCFFYFRNQSQLFTITGKVLIGLNVPSKTYFIKAIKSTL